MKLSSRFTAAWRDVVQDGGGRTVSFDGAVQQPQPPKHSFLLVLGVSFLCLLLAARGTDAQVGIPDCNPVRLEAEDAFYFEKCRTTDVVPGYSGTGFVDFLKMNAFVEWDIDVENEGNHDFTIGFAAHNSRPVDLVVDGRLVDEFLCTGSGSWRSWRQETIRNVYLTEGIHTIRIEASRSTGPNLDYLDVHGPQVSGGGGSIYLLPDTPAPTESPTAPRTPVPTKAPSAPRTPAPTKAPTEPRTPAPALPPAAPRDGNVGNSPQHFEPRDFTTVLNPNERLELGDCKSSPSKEYSVCFNGSGNLVMKQGTKTLWDAGVSGGFRCYLQTDGNMIIRAPNNRALWSSRTPNNRGSKLVIDDGGHLSVMHGKSPIWLRGMPRGEYSGPSSPSLEYPLRGIFYYSWYPETWTVRGRPVKFVPKLGKYSNWDPLAIESHVEQLDYANVDVGIVSWWGEETRDLARIGLLMDKTVELGSSIKWTVYHEDERYEDASVAHLKEELIYIKTWFAWHQAWAHIDGRPVIFVYNEGGCEVVDRWMEAGKDWYVVLKLFPRYQHCSIQPDHWHQYGPGNDILSYKGASVSVSPGFWRADAATPSLPRLSKEDFCGNVQAMVESKEDWQLVTTFNEHGEGTGVESSSAWGSGYGRYLDCLHEIH